MIVKADNVTKRYNYQIIFKNLNYTFEAGNAYAILGPNGSGKSTLLKILSGFLTPTEGEIIYTKRNTQMENSLVYKEVNYAAPYIQLIEDYTLTELFNFHFTFRNLLPGLTIDGLKEIHQLKKANNKYLNEFSSGMKQRVKLTLALLTDSAFVLLDEPLTNLDDAGVAWYHNLIDRYLNNRLLIVASNRLDEYSFCKQHLNILDYK